MSDVCKWCGSNRKASGESYWCDSRQSWQSTERELREQVNILTDALHATWDKPRFDSDGALVTRVMDHDDFDKVRKAMDL